MRFKDSNYFKLLSHSKVEFSFGEFYLFENFVISELYEGIHFDWEKIQEVIGMLIDHYDHDFEIAYVSNRVNSYSTEPQLWVDFYKKFNFIVASAVVFYSDFNYLNATIEKHFSPCSLKRCRTLEEALDWVNQLKEFNQN